MLIGGGPVNAAVMPAAVDMNDSEEFELPPGEAMLYCDCGYKSIAFCFDQHAYCCVSCSEVVFPDLLPFIYAPPPCQQCGAALDRSNRILTSQMKDSSAIACPRCSAMNLRLHKYPVQFLKGDIHDSSPKLGQRIHARTRQPRLVHEPFCFFSPRLRLRLALSVSFSNCERESITDGHHEFLVVDVSENNLVVDYVRQLPEDEWRWYIG